MRKQRNDWDDTAPRLVLPVAEATTIVLDRPHYPENVGAAARAAKTMGILRMGLVRPGRLAVPEHEMARKMAVKSADVLLPSRRWRSLDALREDFDWVVGTSARSGISGVLTARAAAERAVERARAGQRIAVVFGNEKTGLSGDQLARLHGALRIPMAAPQPSINLAQAVQLVAYEWFVAGLAARTG